MENGIDPVAQVAANQNRSVTGQGVFLGAEQGGSGFPGLFNYQVQSIGKFGPGRNQVKLYFSINVTVRAWEGRGVYRN